MTANDADKTRYRQAKAIACQALDTPAPLRASFVETACAGDDGLRHEVLWLIEAAEDPTGDRATLDLDAIATRTGAVDGEAPLPRNNRQLHRLGEGGMGVVYLAERVDGDLSQRVALKLLRLDPRSDPAVARRFTGERRILAGLSHHHIARLVDGGISADGRPFLAMEFVNGERIDQWCRDRDLPLKARIELFLKVCEAVEYAHQRLVIHRDIKPANILVGADGEPKLLDFGIARLLGDEGGGDASRTESDVRALTLAYASPEQIEGGPLGTATDIYSLGIVLYQLIAGVRPFDHLHTAHLLSNAIVSGEILPPSRLVARRKTGRTAAVDTGDGHRHDPTAEAPQARRRRWAWPMRGVPKDVDAIVLKALRREPAQRYASVAELAADLRRFLGSRPVKARRGHWPYRLRRFAWRWRWSLAALLAFVVLLAGFTLERETQFQRTQQERDRAEALAAFMNDLFENADSLRSRGNEVTVRELLDRGARELLARDDLDPPLRRSMLLAMGRAYNALGLGQQALPLLESAYALLPETGIGAGERAQVLGHLSQAYSNSWRIADSIATDARAIELLSADGVGGDEILRLRLRKLHNHTNLLDVPLAQSQAELHAIVDELEARPEPPDGLLMQAYRALTVAYSHPDTADRALAMAERTLDIALRLYRSDDPRLLSTRFVHAMALGQLDPQRAVEPHRSLIADYERVVGPSMSLAAVHSNLGVTLSLLGRLRDSLAEFEQAAGIIQRVGGTDNTLYRITTLNIAAYHADHGDPSRAERLLLERLRDYEAAAGAGAGGDRSRHAQALRILAAAKHRLGSLDRAEALYLDAARIMTPADERSHPQVMAGILLGLADVWIELGRLDDAASMLDRHDRLNADRGERQEQNADYLTGLILRTELLLRRGDAAAAPLATQARALACRTPIQARWWRRLDAARRQTHDGAAPVTAADDCPARPAE